MATPACSSWPAVVSAELSAVPRGLAAGARVTLHFTAEGRTVELPAGVRWVRGSHVGVRLLLTLARASSRLEFAELVVGLGKRREPDPEVAHNTLPVSPSSVRMAEKP